MFHNFFFWRSSYSGWENSHWWDVDTYRQYLVLHLVCVRRFSLAPQAWTSNRVICWDLVYSIFCLDLGKLNKIVFFNLFVRCRCQLLVHGCEQTRCILQKTAPHQAIHWRMGETWRSQKVQRNEIPESHPNKKAESMFGQSQWRRNCDLTRETLVSIAAEWSDDPLLRISWHLFKVYWFD